MSSCRAVVCSCMINCIGIYTAHTTLLHDSTTKAQHTDIHPGIQILARFIYHQQVNSCWITSYHTAVGWDFITFILLCKSANGIILGSTTWNLVILWKIQQDCKVSPSKYCWTLPRWFLFHSNGHHFLTIFKPLIILYQFWQYTSFCLCSQLNSYF